MWSENFVLGTKNRDTKKNSNIDNISPLASAQLPHCHEAERILSDFHRGQGVVTLRPSSLCFVWRPGTSRRGWRAGWVHPWPCTDLGSPSVDTHRSTTVSTCCSERLHWLITLFCLLRGGREEALYTSCIFNTPSCFKNWSWAPECSLFLVLPPALTHHAVRALFRPAHNCMSQ